jgi:hypothetical protein
MPSSGMLRRVVLVRTDVSEELSASSIRVTRMGELGTTLAVTSNRHASYSGRSVGIVRLRTKGNGVLFLLVGRYHGQTLHLTSSL